MIYPALMSNHVTQFWISIHAGSPEQATIVARKMAVNGRTFERIGGANELALREVKKALEVIYGEVSHASLS